MLNFLKVLSGTEFIAAGLALILVLIISLSLHEFGHAFTAYKQGDQTPKAMGRVTLNPLAHIDPIGFICAILFGFGWAKPVQINPIQFKKYRKGFFLTSIAGVTINLILAFIGCALFYGCIKIFMVTGVAIESNWFAFFAYYFTYFLFQINICLFVFNLLPVYPLDGFNMISAFTKYDNKFVNFMYKYGNILLIVLLIFGDTLLFTLCEWVAMPMELLWGLIL